jgi:DNA-directed RNA polymerase specialized sigma24 family protein
MTENIRTSDNHLASQKIFDSRISQCRGLLYFLACRVLGSAEGAEEAVQACLLTASRSPPWLEQEGAFRSWLIRILLDEAALILYRKSGRPKDSILRLLAGLD